MRGQLPLTGAARGIRHLRKVRAGGYGSRAIQISATPTIETPVLTGDALSNSIDTDPAGKRLPKTFDLISNHCDA
jgi:hypothetical protein